ncbi:hypothetical protein BH24ACT4_BH24ACT4_09890 [soil metagenome]
MAPSGSFVVGAGGYPAVELTTALPRVEAVEATVRRVDPSAVWALRARVLRRGQPASAGRFEGDDHPQVAVFAALRSDASAAPVGTATVSPAPCPWRPEATDSWRVRAMATDDEVRGQGIGAQVLDAALAHVAQEGGRLVWCDARVAARTFYERRGFVVGGEQFEVEGIGPHWPMARHLAG